VQAAADSFAVAAGVRTIWLVDRGGIVGNIPQQRARHDVIWQRPLGGPAGRFSYSLTTAFPSPTNPNLIRGMASNPARSASPSAAPPLAPSPGADPWQWSGFPPGGPPPAPHARARPGRNKKEKKTLSRAAKVGIALWNLLDTLSELSEIGGAFWDALPPEIREKYGCADSVSVGQYGLDLTTCKGKALWENWDKIDTAEAFKNIAKNVVEDMTIGQFHKWLSKLYPPGVSFQRTAVTHALSKADPEAYIAGRLKELWEFLGI
jgi:hypothetical protein